MGFPGGSDSKESTCNAGDPGWSLGWEDPLDKGLAAHSSILPWRIPWTEKPGRLQSMGSPRVGHDWATRHTCAHTRAKQQHRSFGSLSWPSCRESTKLHGSPWIGSLPYGKKPVFLNSLPHIQWNITLFLSTLLSIATTQETQPLPFLCLKENFMVIYELYYFLCLLSIHYRFSG